MSLSEDNSELARTRLKRNEYMRRYNSKNKEKVCEKRRENWALNRQKHAELRKKRRAANPERAKELRKAEYVRNKDQILARNKEWRIAYPEKRRAKDFMNKYGMSLKDFDDLLASQGGRCGVCETEEPGGRGWQVDHCHDSGAVRGVLCFRCNLMIGQAGDDPDRLIRAAGYLRRDR